MLHEHTFNVVLGGILADISDFVHAEDPSTALEGGVLFVEANGLLEGGKRADILAFMKDRRVACLETAYDESGANKDAVQRLGVKVSRVPDVVIETAIAVFPSADMRESTQTSLKEKLLAGGTLRYAVHQRLPDGTMRRWPQDGMIEGTVRDLRDFAFATSVSKERAEKTAEEVSERLADAATRLAKGMGNRNARSIARQVSRGSPAGDLQTALLLWLNAILVQCRLADGGFEEARMPRWDCIDTKVSREILDSWRRVLNRNWRDVFEPAVNAMETALSRDPVRAAACLQEVANAVTALREAKLGPFINVGAELFPRLIPDRKTSAAFYTQAGPAEFLAALTIPPEFVAGEKIPVVADFACGTGTLLRSAYRRIRSFTNVDEEDESFHRRMMEEGLIGVDVSPIAAHLTQSGLAAVGGAAPYGRTQIGWVEVGGERHYTGALEYLDTDFLNDLLNRSAGSSRALDAQNDIWDGQAIWAKNESIDCVLMNPPYSRTRGGQPVFDIADLTEIERKGCQERWKKITRNVVGTDKRAGLAASFLALAAKKVRLGGRIGFVLPLTAAFAESWADARELIEREFEDVVVLAVVQGAARRDEALSADTDMEEMMLVGTRRQEARKKCGAIVCVTMYASPIRSGEAGAIANAIRRTIAGLPSGPLAHATVYVGKDEIGIARRWSVWEHGMPWSPLGAISDRVVAYAAALSEGLVLDDNGDEERLPVWMGRMKEVFDVGPTHDLLGHLSDKDPRGAFEFIPIRHAGERYASLWRARAREQATLIVAPTHRGVVPAKGRNSTKELRSRMWATRSTLFYQRGIQWTSQALLGATTDGAAMGGRAWTSLSHDRPEVLQAAALWLNSTFGLLVQWQYGSRTQKGRSTSQVGQISNTPFPWLSSLDDHVLAEAVRVFKELRRMPLRPACQAHADAVRHRIDDAVADMLRLSDGSRRELAAVRHLWCREPSVHGGNKAALRLLSEAETAEQLLFRRRPEVEDLNRKSG